MSLPGYNQVHGPYKRDRGQQRGKFVVTLKLNNKRIKGGDIYFPTETEAQAYADGARTLIERDAHQEKQIGRGNEQWRRLDWWLGRMAEIAMDEGSDPKLLQAMAIAVKEARATVVMLGKPVEDDEKNISDMSYDEIKQSLKIVQ